MKIEVLGTGCAKCKSLMAEAQKAVAASRLPVELSKVEDIEAIMGYGVMQTPALVVDGKIKSMGRIPLAAEIATWISAPGAGH